MKKGLLFAATIALARCGFGQTANPCQFSLSGGTYHGTQTLTLSDTTTGALMFYTTDGSTPTLASTQYTAPLTISFSQTVTCIAAKPGVNQTNAQNNNPSSPGTFWKAVCVKPGCDPGGSGVPTSTNHTSGNASPSISGASMKFAQTAQLNSQTNALWSVNGTFGSGDGLTYFLEDHWYYWADTNASSNEDDDFQFDVTDNFRYMRGMQYCHTGSSCPGGASGWDYGGNSNVPWTNMGVTAGGTSGTWHHLQKLSHRVPSEVTSLPCTASGSWPYNYVDALIIDGVTYNNGGAGWKFCANNLPTGWGAVIGPQAQIDIGPHSTTTTSTTYWDKINYLATFNPSTVASASYVITGISPPVQLEGQVVVVGSSEIQ